MISIQAILGYDSESYLVMNASLGVSFLNSNPLRAKHQNKMYHVILKNHDQIFYVMHWPISFMFVSVHILDTTYVST